MGGACCIRQKETPSINSSFKEKKKKATQVTVPESKVFIHNIY